MKKLLSIIKNKTIYILKNNLLELFLFLLCVGALIFAIITKKDIVGIICISFYCVAIFGFMILDLRRIL